MKVVFLSNYFNHHQKFLSEALIKRIEGSYRFFETEEMTEERKKQGWGMKDIPLYVERIENNEKKDVINDADYVILGSAPSKLIKERLDNNKITFLYRERIYKKDPENWKLPARFLRHWMKYGRYKNFYLLCASAYTSADFAKTFVFIDKAYKWGYFPETIKYDINDLLNKKDKKKILWCGRFIGWKHPDDVLLVAERLKADGYDFEINFIGTGEIENLLKEKIIDKELDENVKLLGPMKPESVRRYMEEAGIYLFTSDFQEGWGAVLNESMNSGCAVIASHAIGSVPYLMKHNENGLIYKNGDINDLYNKVKYLLDNHEEQMRLGRQAYNTIVSEWNAEVAAQRFVNLAKEIEDHGYCDLYSDGPCSKAQIIKNDWFRG